MVVLSGVTGAAGVIAANNVTEARIGLRSNLFANDSIRVQATDDTEIDGIVITGAGGAVGVSGSVGTYIVKSRTSAIIDENAVIAARANGDGITALAGEVDWAATQTRTQSSRDQEGTAENRDITLVDASFTTETVSGLSVAAVTNEDINFAPIGVAGGAVGVAGVVATTAVNSTTEAQIKANAMVNAGDNSAAAATQSVKMLAASESQLNNVSSGVGVGGVAVTFDIDTQVFKKTVQAKMLGSATAKQDIGVFAESRDRVLQTAVGIAGGAGDASSGVVEVSVVGDNVLAEIGDNAVAIAGDDVTVSAVQNLSMVQTAGNVAAGSSGIGSSLGVLIAKSSNIARIGNSARVHAVDDLFVTADTTTNLNQNIAGFAGGGTVGFTGSIGVNILKTTTVAEIGASAQINQESMTDDATQSVTVAATDNLTSQAAAGAVAIGGAAGVGIGVTATVTRNTTRASIGDSSVVSALQNVSVRADSTKNISNQGVAAAGGVGVGAAGSVALTLIGGTMSSDASDSFQKDSGGNLMTDAETAATSDRSAGNDDTHNGHQTSGKSNQLYASSYNTDADTLAESEAAGINNDVLGGSADSTQASIGSNVTINNSGTLNVVAEETISLSQISGGAAVGSVGVGGFVAVADYGGAVGARIGNNTTITGSSALNVNATLNSGADKVIDLPGGSTVTVSGVNSTVIGASVGLVGLAASVANVNLAENVTAAIGDNVTVTLADSSSTVNVDALRDVDADVRVASVAAGLVAAGVSYSGVNALGNVSSQLGNSVSIGTNLARVGAITVRARNRSTQDALAYSMGAGYGGAAVGAVVNVDDVGNSSATIGTGTSLYSSGSISLLASDTARNRSDALGVAIAAGVGLSVISSDIDVNRDAIVSLGNNSTIVGRDISLASTAGENSHFMADANVVGASGGLLVGATGSENLIDVDSNANVLVGSGVTVSVNALDVGNNVVAGNALTVNATNNARARGVSNGFALGAAAIGAHVTKTTQTGGTRVEFGAGLDSVIKGDATFTSQSSKQTFADLVGGSGGLLAVNGGEAVARQTSSNQIVIADGANAADTASLNVSGNLVMLAANNDKYDSVINASAIGLAAVTGGLSNAIGNANVGVRLGNHSTLRAHQLDITTNNRLTKDGIVDADGNDVENFNFDGGGGLTVTMGYAQAVQNQTSNIHFGQQSDVFVTGARGDEGVATIKALSLNKMDTRARVSTGGAISIPQSLARNTAVSSNGIYFEDGSLLATQRGNMNLRTSGAADIDSHAKTSVWGLAGAGAAGKAYATLTSNETINLANGSVVRANGYMNAYAGEDIYASDINVLAKTSIYNKTLIPITTGLVANADVTRNVLVNVATGGGLQSARHMNVRANKGALTVSGNGKHQFLVLGVPVDDSFGDATKTVSSKINIDGRIETGIFNEQYIGFGSDFGNYGLDANGNTERRTITELNGRWFFNDDNSEIVVSKGSYSDDLLTTMRSGDEASWTFLKNQNLANDIQAEIDALNIAKAAAANPDAAAALQTRLGNLNTQRAEVAGYDAGGEDIASEISTQQLRRSVAQTDQAACDDSVTPGCTSTQQGIIDDATTNINDLTTFQNDIASNGAGADDFDTTAALANIDAQISSVQAQINDISDSATASNIDTEIAFLTAMRDNLTTGAVDVIEVGDLFAATGHILAKADTLTGSATGTVHSEHEVNITVRNDSANPIRVGNIEIPNDPGGNVYFNEQLVSNASDIRHINIDKTADVNFGLSMSPNNFTTNVTIESRFDPTISSYNPTVNGSVMDVPAPEIVLAGTIENRGGTVSIKNRHGSVHQSGQINASKVALTSGGALFVNNKTPGILQYGPHPESNNGFGTISASRLDSIGIADADAGGCSGAPGNLKLDPNNGESCTHGNLSNTGTYQADEDSYSIVADKIFIVANTINLNSVIQSGIAQKDITVNASHSEFSLNDGNTHAIVTNDIAYNNANGLNREGTGNVFASYNSTDDVVEISGLEAKGGEITIAGKLISTGHGQINVLDGYGTFNVVNNSSKDVRLNLADTGEIEGKITLIDNAKDNGFGNPLVTQYTREGDTVRVRSNLGSKGSTPVNVVAGLDGSSGRQSHYDPLTDLRYFWIQGEDIGVERNYRRNMSAWETFGINHSFHANYIPPTSSFNSATALPASALPMADYAAVDSSTNADYRLRPKFIQESYSLTSSDEGRHCSGIPWLVRKCWWDQVSVERESGTMMYFQDVKADKRVNVKFIGSDTGSLNVTSAGGIKINGNVRSVGGNTRLIATGGDIALTNAQATIELGNLEILASGSIGTADTPLRLQQVAGATIDATAGTGMNIRSEAGSLLFTDLDNTNGDVTLYAGQNIEVETGTNAINGDDITMTALYGSITESGGGSMRLDTSGTGIFNAKSRTGGLDFSEISGNLQLGTVDAIGNVALTTLSGSILDNNEVQSDDVETQAELLDLWEDLQLRGTDAATKRTNQIATYERESTELYQDYWRLRDVQQDADGNYIAQDYNPNFSYTASAAERTAMNNDAGRIASYEASQQARYQKGHEQFGGASYDPTYAHVASSDESDIFTAGYYWADHELEVPLPGAAFKETTDTTAYVESANIIGDNISLTVAGGNIGAYSTIANYDIADVIDGNLTSAQKLQLSAAESDDLSFDNMDAITAAPTLDADGNEIEKPALSGILTLTEREDLDIEARNQASVVTINAPSGYAFIGGENSAYGLNIDTLAAAGEVRLKVNGDVKNARADNAAVLSSQSAVIESGDGAIGAAATPFRVDVANGAKITARALGGVYIEETAGDMNIGQIYSPNRIELTSAGRLLDAGADLIMDVKGDVVQLTANGSIGEQFNVGDSVLTRKQKALDVGSVNYGTSQFEVTSNTDGACALWSSWSIPSDDRR